MKISGDAFCTVFDGSIESSVFAVAPLRMISFGGGSICCVTFSADCPCGLLGTSEVLGTIIAMAMTATMMIAIIAVSKMDSLLIPTLPSLRCFDSRQRTIIWCLFYLPRISTFSFEQLGLGVKDRAFLLICPIDGSRQISRLHGDGSPLPSFFIAKSTLFNLPPSIHRCLGYLSLIFFPSLITFPNPTLAISLVFAGRSM